MKKCKHEDAVYWNEFNKVVQCHKCGIIFIPTPKLIIKQFYKSKYAVYPNRKKDI